LKLVLTEIPGVGKKRATVLHQRFGSLKKLSKASVDEVAAVPGISPALAKQILDYLSTQDY
jgi:excinuclease ABC subunit C